MNTNADQKNADPLAQFISTAKQRGMSDESLTALLRQRGWPERRIYDGLAAHYETALGVIIPSRGSRGEQARDAYLGRSLCSGYRPY